MPSAPRSRGGPGAKVIKAMRVRSSADIQAAEAFRTDYHLLDAYRPGDAGRNRGELRLGARRGLAAAQVPVILAGGLTPTTSARRSRSRGPFAVDVASGVESAPGVKDHALMAAFAEAARPAVTVGEVPR